jgi:hypothetical protein
MTTLDISAVGGAQNAHLLRVNSAFSAPATTKLSSLATLISAFLSKTRLELYERRN